MYKTVAVRRMDWTQEGLTTYRKRRAKNWNRESQALENHERDEKAQNGKFEGNGVPNKTFTSSTNTKCSYIV